jgi:hypothetical protein
MSDNNFFPAQDGGITTEPPVADAAPVEAPEAPVEETTTETAPETTETPVESETVAENRNEDEADVDPAEPAEDTEKNAD